MTEPTPEHNVTDTSSAAVLGGLSSDVAGYIP
jgi:hypothetical protein